MDKMLTVEVLVILGILKIEKDEWFFGSVDLDREKGLELGMINRG